MGIVKSERAAESKRDAVSGTGCISGSAARAVRRIAVSSTELPIVVVLDGRREYVLLPTPRGGLLMNGVRM